MTSLRKSAKEAVHILRQAGFESWWVGGAVRDLLMGREPSEYDIATTALPQQVVDTCETRGLSAMLVGKKFGVVRVRLNDHWFEIATLRTETGYGDHRHPESVRYTTKPQEDARRRDFTINAMYMDPESGQVLDFVEGRKDLEKRSLRTVGPPKDRFQEDHLRKLRLARFCSQLAFSVHEETLKAVKADPGLQVSPERINQEFSLLLTSAEPGFGLNLLLDTGVLEQFLPEAAALKGCEQPEKFHPEGDVWTHTLLMFKKAHRPISECSLSLGLLLHDIGKPPCKTFEDGRMRFPRHDSAGAEMTVEILTRLRYPREIVQNVSSLVKMHMSIKDAPKMREAKLLRLLADPLFPLHLELHRLDCLASHGKMEVYNFLLEKHEEWLNLPHPPEPFINGHDLIDMGLPPGPEIGRILEEVYDAQLEGSIDSRNQALELARGLANLNGK